MKATAQTSGKEYRVSLHQRILTIENSSGHARKQKTTKRGTINGLSDKSRARFVRLLARVNRPDNSLFLTLTYRSFSEEWREWKHHLRAFRAVFYRRFPNACGFWRLQFQERGAPHFHLLLWTGEETEIEVLEERLGRAWGRITGDKSAAHLKYGVDVEHVTDWRKSSWYVAAYAANAKQDRTDIQTGREWGVWSRERLGLEPTAQVELSDGQFQMMRRIIRRLYKAYHRGKPGKLPPYFYGLKRNQPFSSFLPLHESRRLLRFLTHNDD